MSDERALLAAICANPEEDTPRLMYADWLDDFAGSLPAKKRESARARAELIRVQCELAQLPPEEEDAETATRRVELELRQDELLANAPRRKEWAKPLQPPPEGHGEFVPDENRFVRGFPEFAQNPYTENNGYLTVGESLFDISPVHAIDCRNIHGEAADEFLALPWLPRLRRLSVSTNLDRSRWETTGVRHWVSSSDGTDVPTTEKLFAAPGLANLEELELRSWEFGPPGRPVTRRPLTALRKLVLSGGIVRGPEAFVRLGELLPPEVRLRDFELGGCRYGAEELRTLCALPQLQHLERLTLGSRFGEDGWPTEGVGEEGVRAITAAPFWPRLRAFLDHTGGSAITADEMGAFIAAPPAPNLRTLVLAGSNHRMGFVSLLSSPLLSSVTTLDLSNVRYGDFFASNLRWAPHLKRLLHLKVNNCEIATKGVRSLAEAPFAANLVRLELRGGVLHPLRKQAVDALVAPGNFPRLRYLDVSQSVPNREQQKRLRKRFGNGVKC